MLINKVSVHLITYNGEKYLPHCLKSLQDQVFKDFSVLIIDNGSKDQTVQFLDNYLIDPKHKRLSAKTKFIKNSKNNGFAGAHNQAIQWTKSEYVFMMNQDVILDSGYIKHLVDFMDNHPEAAAVTGVIFKWDFGKIEQSSDLGKTKQTDSLGLKILPNHKVVELADQLLLGQKGEAKEIFGVSGALPIYRRSALEYTKIPLFHQSFKLYINRTKPKLYEYFDNDFFSYKEDVDLAYRLRLFDFKAYLVPKAKGWHDRTAGASASAIKNRKQKSDFVNYHSYKNHLYFLVKNIPSKIWQRHFYQIIFYEAKKLIDLIILEQKTLGALKEFIKNFSKMIKKRVYIQKKAGKNAWGNIEQWI
jgi:GT2 family glycosyltransferase